MYPIDRSPIVLLGTPPIVLLDGPFLGVEGVDDVRVRLRHCRQMEKWGHLLAIIIFLGIHFAMASTRLPIRSSQIILGLSLVGLSIGSPHNPLLLLCFSSSPTRHQQQHHHSGRRWRVRRKTQTFLPSPVQDVSPEDECALFEQLGYLPSNICCVSARDTSGRPIAIKSYPLVVQQLVKNVADSSSNSNNNSEINNNKTPFPTLYWFSCPHISRAISELEREGYIRIFQQRIEDDVDKLGLRWWKCHEQYANERWRLLSTHDRDWLFMPGELKEIQRRQSMREMIEMSGVAGTNHHHCYEGGGQGLGDILCVPSVKCLHSHYAHYRSQLTSLQSSENTRDDDIYGKIVLNMVGQWTHESLLESFPGLML